MLTSDQYRSLIYNNNGTNAINVLYATQAYLDVYVCNILVRKFSSNQSIEILINILTILLPCLFRTLIPVNNYFLTFNILQVSIILSLYKSIKPTTKIPLTPKIIPVITTLRSSLFLKTSIAILAVDFKLFYLPFSKTTRYGYSLMDTGVGLFTIMNGVSHKPQKPLSLALIFCLGIARFLSVSWTNYKVNVTEYGTHWNFFLTIFCLKFFLNIIHIKHPFKTAIFLNIINEIVMEYFRFKNYVLNPNLERTNFINANREGILSLPGYLSLYLYGVTLKNHFRDTKILKLRFFVIVTLISLTFHYVLGSYFGLQLSRKLVNFTYCLWIIFICCSITVTLLVMELIFPKLSHDIPLFFRAINQNPLSFFLLSNLFTGTINLCLDTLSVSNNFISFLIIFVYCSLLFTVSYFFYFKNVKLF